MEKNCNFQIKKINVSVKIFCSIEEEYVDIPNIFIGTDSQATAEKAIQVAKINLNYHTYYEMC